MSNQSIIKQKVEINISFHYDYISAQEEYDRLTDLSQYTKKGFSEQQAKYYNRLNQKYADRINNDQLYLINTLVKCQVYNSKTGQIEEYFDSLGGSYYDPYTDSLDDWDINGYFEDMINQVKSEIQKDGIDLNTIEFSIVRDNEIKWR